MKSLIFATGNEHKLEEIREKLPNGFAVTSMREIGFDGDIPETGKTLSENASIKADFIHSKYNVDCFADDTGLEIEALGGEPGVFSARYAGENCSFEDNTRKVLDKLSGISNRQARFVTVIHLILGNKHYSFNGLINGTITSEPRGEKGFGYDPIFIPSGQTRTFAEMSLDEKNQISHRAIAVKKLADFLNTRNG
ncbi:MAG: RdgB/HAM1 family non-canonical purine NTP pyrophosphatase [Flavobacteriales bacterium]